MSSQYAITVADKILQSHEEGRFKAMDKREYDDHLGTLAGYLLELADFYIDCGCLRTTLEQAEYMELEGAESMDISYYEPFSFASVMDRAILAVATTKMSEYFDS